MPESSDEMLDRVRLMADGDPKWDLSDNDVAALKYVLGQAALYHETAKERDDAIATAAEKILESNARSAIAVNCAKAMAMFVDGKINEDTCVEIINSAETHMLEACKWIEDRDAAVMEELGKANKKALYWEERFRNRTARTEGS